MKEKVGIYLVVCTRNRNNLLLDLLREIKKQTLLPTKIVIVDSSDKFRKIPTAIIKLFPKHTIFHISSLPGLPFQRNQGVNFVKTLRVNKNDLISFMDDDIRPAPIYFDSISRIANRNEQILGFTGVNVGSIQKNSYLGKIFLLSSKRQGKILKSGKTTPPVTFKDYEFTDWAPGGSMNFRARVFDNIAFRDEIRMYGEDLDFSLRFKKFGQIIVVGEARYAHLKSVEGKDNIKTITKYSDLTQLMFSIEHPKIVKKLFVIWSVVGMMGLNIRNIMLNRSRESNKNELIGHLDFFKSVIMGDRLLQ